MSRILLPVTQEALEVPEDASPAEIDEAVARCADAGRTAWAADHRRRAAALNAWADRLQSEQEGLVGELVEQTGKIRAEARAEIAGSIDALRFNAGLCRLPLGRGGSFDDRSHSQILREPVGPTVFITPWNWPVLLLLRDLAPAFAAGVTALVKPSPQTFHITRRIIGLGREAGIGEGILELVPGDGAVGEELIRHPDTAAVAITGSTAAGQAVLRTAAETMTRPLLELGGKASMLVLPDADHARALAKAARASVTTAGQMCMACTRVLVHQDRLHEAAEALTRHLGGMVAGSPEAETTDLGPLVSEAAFEKVAGYVAQAHEEGSVLVGGEQVRPPGTRGFFLSPAVVTGLEASSPVVQEDIFGPVLSLEAYRTEEEALELLNATPFGLAASIWSGDPARAMGLAREVRAGTVWVNGYNRSYPEAPSGGYKMSGMGRTRGVEGIEQFTEIKHVHLSLEDHDD